MSEQNNLALQKKIDLRAVGQRLWRMLPWLWLAAGYAFSIWFMVRYGRSYLDSDMASEMVLADQLNREGGLLSTNWFYSTELRVVYIQMAFRLGLVIFPANWHLARVFGVAVLMAALAAAYLFFAHSAGFARLGVWSCAALMWPFGYWYLFLSVFGSYYIPHILFMLLPVALALRWAKNHGKWQAWLDLILLAGLSGLAGLNGVRMLMNCFLPLALAAAVMLGMALYQKPETLQKGGWRRSPETRFFAGAALAGAASLAGYLVNDKILTKTHHFRTFDDRAWGALDLNAWNTTLGDFLSLFGYQQGASLFSVTGICAAFGLVTAAAVVICAVRLLFRWAALTFGQRTVLAFFWSGILLDSMIYAFTAGNHGYTSSYWLPLVPFAFAVLQIEGETEHFRLPSLRRVLAVGFAACILLTSVSSVKYFLDVPLRAQPQLQDIAQWLLDHGYTEGYASFWDCNVLTELTSGQIEMWNVKDINAMEINEWLQPVDHETTQPQGRTFVLVNSQPIDYPGDVLTLPYAAANGANIVYQDSTFTIFAFDHAQEIYDAEAAAAAAANAAAQSTAES